MDKVIKENIIKEIKNIGGCLDLLYRELKEEEPELKSLKEYVRFIETFLLDIQKQVGYEGEIKKRYEKKELEIKKLRNMVNNLKSTMSGDSIEKAQNIMEKYSNKIKEKLEIFGIVNLNMTSHGMITIKITFSIHNMLSFKTFDNEKDKEQTEKKIANEILKIKTIFDTVEKKNGRGIEILYNEKNRKELKKFISSELSNSLNIKGFKYEAGTYDGTLKMKSIEFLILSNDPIHAMVI